MNTGMVVDFDTVKTAWNEVKLNLDHRHLNELLGDTPSAEIVGVYIYGQMMTRIPGVVLVEVRETPKAGAKIGKYP